MIIIENGKMILQFLFPIGNKFISYHLSEYEIEIDQSSVQR